MTCREAVLIMTVLGLVGVVHTNAYSDEKLEEAMRQEALLRHYTELVAKCKDSIDGRTAILSWTDDVTGWDMSTRCHTVRIGVIHAR